MSEVKARANALLQDALGPSEERIRGTLRDVGFSSSAAEAFCALIRVREATAGDLVRKTGIPDSKIYYALDELAEKVSWRVKPESRRPIASCRRKRWRFASVGSSRPTTSDGGPRQLGSVSSLSPLAPRPGLPQRTSRTS